MENYRFEWDEDKHDANIKKHGVSFVEAMSVFDDPHARYFPDTGHSSDEDRFVIVGFSSFLRMLVVCHCYRGDDLVRIISARKATKKEEALYGGF